jgi:hypothetical protein
MMMKRLLLTGFATAVLAVGSMQAQDAQRRADKQYELKAYDLALNSYQQLYNADQDNEQLEVKIAACYTALCNDVVAASWYSRVEDQLLLATVAIDYGKVLKRLGEYDKAKKVFALALPYQREQAEYYITSCDYAKVLLQDDYQEVYPAAFNTQSADFGLSFYGETPVFCSFDDQLSFVRPTQKGEGNRIYSVEEDILLNNNRVYNLRPATQVNYGLGPIAYAGDQCAYVRNHLANGVRHISNRDTDASIYLAAVVAGGDFTREVAFPYNGTDYATTHPHLTEDGQSLYFASNREGGYGGYDIYRSDKIDGEWSLPINCGPSVNTPGHEITPALMDGKLIFASDYHIGLGGYDLFASLIDGIDYRAAENMGHGINSPADEYYPAAMPGVDRLYFTSNRLGGRGLEDIYVSERLGAELVAPPVYVINQGVESTPAQDDVMLVAANETITKRSITPSGHISTNYSIDEVLASQRAQSRTAQEVSTIAQAPARQVASTAAPVSTYGQYVYVDVQPILIEETKAEIIIVETEAIDQTEVADDAIAIVEVAPTPAEVVTSDVSKELKAPAAYRIPDLSAGSSTVINENVRSVADIDVARRVWSGSDLPPAASVYFVQVAAFNKRSVNLSSYEELVKFGNIYKVYKGSAVKVRLGYFGTEEEARQALRNIKAQGYRDAFLTYQALDINNLELVFSSYDYDVNARSTTTSNSSVNNSGNAEAYEPSSYMVRKKWTGDSRYKVRLASYEDPKFFDLSRADDIGRIEQWTKGGWTIFLTSGYQNLEEAEAARRKAVNKGFRDAEVVLDNDGILERLKKN